MCMHNDLMWLFQNQIRGLAIAPTSPVSARCGVKAIVTLTRNPVTLLMRHLTNYDDPVCCVATVCHRGQARCMYWGHLGHIYRAISHLKWCKIVWIRYLARTFIQMKSSNTFFMFLQSEVPRHFRWRFNAVWIYTFTVFMFMYINVDLKLCRNMGIWNVCMLRPPGKIYLGFG